MKLTVKVCLVLRAGQPRLQIRIRDHFRTRFDVMNSTVASKLANELPLKITFFEVSTIVSVSVKF